MLLLAQGRHWVRSNLFKGQGDVHVSDLLGHHQCNPFTAILACQLQPQATVGKHQQVQDHELLVIQSGEGIAIIDQHRYVLQEGVVLYIQQGSILALENTHHEEILSYYIIKAKS